MIYGPYGEAWAIPMPLAPPFVPKGPGIKGGGVAAVGACVGLVGTVAVAIAYVVGTQGAIDVNEPWFLLASQLALWAGSGRRRGRVAHERTGSLVATTDCRGPG